MAVSRGSIVAPPRPPDSWQGSLSRMSIVVLTSEGHTWAREGFCFVCACVWLLLAESTYVSMHFSRELRM
jgi:uncharacterized Fe-S cluster-containing MiaB family protein